MTQYQHLKHGGDKILVDAAIRDGNGAKIDTTYATKTELAGKADTGTSYTKGETDTLLSGKAPTSHADSTTTYGQGDSTHYGHVKVDDAMSDTSVNPVQNGVVKSFINSSIATNTAFFKGTYGVVSDLGLTVSATHAQVATALGVAVSSPTNNDYCFVEFPASGSDAGRYDRYKYDGVSWGYEYTLNNSSFTQAQWDSINSGITSAKVTKIDNAHIDATSVSVTFALQGTPDYASWPFRASYSNANITANTFADVVLSGDQAVSGDYAPFCETAAGVLYLYAKAAVGTVTIPTIHMSN